MDFFISYLIGGDRETQKDHFVATFNFFCFVHFFSKQNFCRKFFSQTVLSLSSSGGTGGTGVMLVLV